MGERVKTDKQRRRRIKQSKKEKMSLARAGGLHSVINANNSKLPTLKLENNDKKKISDSVTSVVFQDDRGNN